MTAGRPLSDTERLDWLRLIRAEGIGPITFRALLRRFGTAASALEALPAMARAGGRKKPLRVPSRSDAEREMAAVARLQGRLLALGEPGYPILLAAIDDPPPLLAVRGDAGLLDRRAVAVVGARNASLNGRRFAERLAGALGRQDLVVVSGLARGIDAAAHQGALATGTVAVVAGGVDVVYPPEHRALYERIVEGGAVVSECPPGTEPTARHFPRRNRLIAGLALAAVVVEAAQRSGSLITARLAAQQGRDVFAVPGSPLDPRAGGCNALIRQGATLVRHADDVLEGLPAQPPPTVGEPTTMAAAVEEPAATAGDMERIRRSVLERLSPTPTKVDEVVRDCQTSASAVLTVLLELELAGRVERQPGNRVSLL